MFFPLWKIEKLENKLNEMEEQGYRLDCIKYSYWFYFKKATPKSTDYILTYNMPRDNQPGMYIYERKLLSEHSASVIKSSKYNVFRITGENRDFNDLIGYRSEYFQHVYFQFMLASLLPALILAVPLILSIHFNGAIVTNDMDAFAKGEFVFSMIFEVVLLFFAVYYFYGYIQQKKKVKKWERDNLKK